jgi:starch synthase
MALNIALLAAEIAPLAKTGGLADVTNALTRYLHGMGHDVRPFLPLYSTIDTASLRTAPIDFLSDVPLEVGPHRYRYSVLSAQLPGSRAPVYLVDCPVLYGRGSIYTTDADEHLRFLALTRAALECCQRMGWSPHILHCHDWHAAFGPLFLKTIYAWDRLFQSTRSVLTLHNVGYQGVFGAGAVDDLQLGMGRHFLHQHDLAAGIINSLKHGILHADEVTTVSPTYAKELCTAEYGMGLEGVITQRGDAVIGILNGVDYREWNPRTDRYLPRHYDATRLSVKGQLKRVLARRLGLECGEETPLAGVVSRLVYQKGIDLLVEALARLFASRDLVCAVLGSGEAPYERALAELARAFPGRLVFQRGYDEELAHWIEAASDLYVMPSRYEPCGLNQMYSLRYGSVPVVRETGGLADSVEPFDPESGKGTGFLFKEYDPAALEQALARALDLYHAPALWTRMVHNGMAQDFSWARSGAEYVRVFERLAGLPVGAPA